MKAIKIDRSGEVTLVSGDDDFWMEGEGEDTVWAEGEYLGEPAHTIYYDDEAMTDPGEVRAVIAGREFPLPVWIVGVDGEKTTDVALDVEKVRKDLNIPR